MSLTDRISRRAPAPPGSEMNGAGRPAGSSPEAPNRPRQVSSSMVLELVDLAVAAFCVIWVVFTIGGISAPFGMLVVPGWCSCS